MMFKARVGRSPQLPKSLDQTLIGSVVVTAAVCTAMLVVYGAFVSFGDLEAFLGKLDFASVLSVLGLACANYMLRAVRWNHFSRSIGLRTTPVFDLLLYVSGFAFTLSPGKIGELVRLWFLRRRYGYSFFRTLPLMIGDRYCDLFALAIILIASARYPILGSTGLTIVVLGFFGVLVLVLLNRDLVRMMIDCLFALIRRWPRFFAKLRELARAYREITSLKCYAVALPLSVLGWLAEVAVLFVVARQLGTNLSFVEAAFVFSAATMVGALSLVPGGLGGADVSMVGLLIYIGATSDSALSITFIVRASTLWFAVVIGLAVMPLAAAASRRPI